jgi:hypothetical protein
MRRDIFSGRVIRNTCVLLGAFLGILSAVRAQAAGAWIATGPLNHARAGHTATLLSDGRVLVTGGVGTGFLASDTAELYNPATGAFAPTGKMVRYVQSTPRRFFPTGRS